MFFSFNHFQKNFEIRQYLDKATMLADTPSVPTIGYVYSWDMGENHNRLVETDDYVFSATEPENPAEGLLWLQIGDKGPANLPVLLDGTVYVYPIKAQIYNGESWVVNYAFIYVDEWKPFSQIFLYQKGDLCEETGGRWASVNLGYSGESTAVCDPVNENNSLTVNFTKDKYGAAAASGMMLSTVEPIDLTNYKTLVFKGLFEYENTNSHALYGVWKDFTGANYREAPVAKAEYTANNTEPVVIDVSTLEGVHYVCVGMRSCRVRIDECYLEM